MPIYLSQCDENIPCRSCAKRAQRCSLEDEAEAAKASQSQARESPPEGHIFIGDDNDALFRHYVESTAYCITSTSTQARKSPFIFTVPELAPHHPYLMHELLAITALHLDHLHPHEGNKYLKTAAEHQSQALNLFRAALQDPPAEAVVPIWLCSALLVNYYFALPTDPASLLFNSDVPRPPEWMILMRGTSLIFRQHYDALSSHPVIREYIKPYAEPLQRYSPTMDFPDRSTLVSIYDKLVVPPEDQERYSTTLTELTRCFWVSSLGDPESLKSAPITFAANVPVEFLSRLALKHQPALVVMAYWCVLMHRVPYFGWYKNAKAKELLAVLKGDLAPEYLELIRWPIQEIEGDQAP